MPTIKDLKFEKVYVISKDKAPVEVCNCCGKKNKITSDWYIAEFKINESNHISFLCCSAKCVAHLHSPGIAALSQRIIDDAIHNAAILVFGRDSDDLNDFLIKNNIEK